MCYLLLINDFFTPSLLGWKAPKRSSTTARQIPVDFFTRNIQGETANSDESSLGESLGSSDSGSEEDEDEDNNEDQEKVDYDVHSLSHTISSFSLTGEKKPSKGGIRNGRITIKGIDPSSPFHRAFIINPESWTDGNDTFASACFLLPSCYKSQGGMEQSRFCATILPNRKEVQIDLRLPYELTCGESSAYFFGLPHHDAASAAFLGEVSKRRNNNHLLPCKESIVFCLPFEVEPDFCDNPPTGNGCVVIREADGAVSSSRHFLFTVKKRSARYLPRVQTNDFSFNPYEKSNVPNDNHAGSAHRSPYVGYQSSRESPAAATAAQGFVGEAMDGIVPISPTKGGGMTTPQKRQKNN